MDMNIFTRHSLRLLFLVALFAAPHPCHAQKWDVGKARIGYGKTGFDNIAQAIDAFPTAHPDGLAGKFIYMGALFSEDDTLQAELLATLRADAPRELKAALRSSGNIHNPALDPLIDPFKRALMKTTLAKNADTALAKQGLKITGVDYEEFCIDKSGGKIRFSPIVWLQIGLLK